MAPARQLISSHAPPLSPRRRLNRESSHVQPVSRNVWASFGKEQEVTITGSFVAHVAVIAAIAMPAIAANLASAGGTDAPSFGNKLVGSSVATDRAP